MRKTNYVDEHTRRTTTWAVRLNEPEKAFMQGITDEYKITIGEFITILANSLRDGELVFEGKKFKVPVRNYKYTDEHLEIERLVRVVERYEKDVEHYKEQIKIKEDLSQLSVSQVPYRSSFQIFWKHPQADLNHRMRQSKCRAFTAWRWGYDSR